MNPKSSDTGELLELLRPYGPRLPLAPLVEELNRIYHRHEAAVFDRIHPSDFRLMPSIWKEMSEVAEKYRTAREWRILDFGCGTGFEAGQVMANFPPNSIERLVCYDISPDMLSRCKSRVSPLLPAAIFSTDLDAVSANGPFNLLVTSQMLHHLTDPMGVINSLRPMLTQDAIWIASHEPSVRFYINPECLRAYESFLRDYRWRKYLKPAKYLQRLRRLLGLDNDIEQLTADEAVAKELFRHTPPRELVLALVDFQCVRVCEPTDNGLPGRGLDFMQISEELSGVWDLIFIKTYNFMGPFDEQDLPGKYRAVCRDLARKYPLDGAHHSAVWRRSAVGRGGTW